MASSQQLESLPDPPEVMVDFIRRLPQPREEVQSLRRRPRRSIAMTCLVTPMDEALNPVGEPFHAVTRDVSTIGVAILYTRPISAPVLKVELPLPASKVLRVVMRVVRRTKLGPYYDIAGEMIYRTDQDSTVIMG